MANELWVYAEHEDGVWHAALPELAGEARALADKAGATLAALVLAGAETPPLDELGASGIEMVYLVRHPGAGGQGLDACAAVATAALRARLPWAFLAAATPRASELCAVVAARLGTALVPGCVAFDLAPDGTLQMVRPVYGGKLHARVACPAARPPILTLHLRGAMGARRRGSSPAIEELALPAASGPSRLETIGHLKADPATVDLAEADIVVAGGRGVGSAAGFAVLHDLAAALGAAVGGTRLAVDEGWLPFTRQIGLSGRVIAPRLYVACGISGAIHHTGGIKESKLIVAINSDRHAPIFKLADVGIVGDLHAVVPALTDAVQRAKQNKLGRSATALVGEALDGLRPGGPRP